jgi:diguanylate cyclase (GGDEF)-like protein/PAS domain S-box-containing protein
MSPKKERTEETGAGDHTEIQLALSEKYTAKLGRMFAALSASNEAILRAKSRQELFQWVCDAAVHGSKFSNCSVMLPEGDKWVRLVARTGATAAVLADIRISVDESVPEGRGTVGTAYRTGKPCVTNDFLNDERTQAWHEVARKAGWNSGGAFPIIQQGVCVGVVGFNSFDKDVFDEEMIVLLQRVAENIAFALDNFERQERLRESEERFRSLTELSSDWYWEQDSEFRFTRLVGQTVINGEMVDPDNYLGKTRWDAGLQLEGGWDAHQALLARHLPYRHVVMYRTQENGGRSYISVSGQPRFDADGNFVGYRGVGRDITPQKLAEDRIQYLATHDGLTGLANRIMFSELLNLAIHSARRYKRNFAVMFIDLDHFKNINDTLGHEAGDRLLREIANRLTQELRSSDVVARLGGDEFVILVQEVLGAEQVAAVAQKILTALVKPVTLSGQECRVTASIGISMFPSDAQDEETLMKNADLAMYRAKECGKNNFQLFSDKTDLPP